MNEFIPYSFGMIDKEKLVELREQGKTLRECAEAFGVCFQAVAKALARIKNGSKPIGRPRKAPDPAPSGEAKRPRGRPKNLKTRLPGDEYAESGISKPSIHAGLRKKAGRPRMEDREEVRVRVLSGTAEKIRQRGSKWFREFLENEIN